MRGGADRCRFEPFVLVLRRFSEVWNSVSHFLQNRAHTEVP